METSSLFKQYDVEDNRYVAAGKLQNLVNSSNTTNTEYIHETTDSSRDQRLELKESSKSEDIRHLCKRYLNSYVNYLIPQPPILRLRTLASDETDISLGTLEVKLDETDIRLKALEFELDETDNIQYVDHCTCWLPPIFIIIITAIEVLLQIIEEATRTDSSRNGAIMTILEYEPTKRYEFWRYLTYMLIHAGYYHLSVNLTIQLLLGIPLEMVHKWWRVLVIYFTGVIAGSLVHSISDPQSPLVGASGGVYSLLTAHIANVIMNYREMTQPLVQLFIFCIIVSSDIGYSIYQRYSLGIETRVSVMAHFGGAVAGLLVGIYILKNLIVKKFEKYLWWTALIIYVLLISIAIILNVVCPGHFST